MTKKTTTKRTPKGKPVAIVSDVNPSKAIVYANGVMLGTLEDLGNGWVPRFVRGDTDPQTGRTVWVSERAERLPLEEAAAKVFSLVYPPKQEAEAA